MSKASDGAPVKRKSNPNETAEVDDPVKVTWDDGDTLLGIVRERHEYDEYDAPARVVVEGADREVNVSAERVDVAVGANADVVRSLVGGQEDV
jgi:hypothetical protein